MLSISIWDLNKKMISFIVIGRNEGIRLQNCMKSIVMTIKANNLNGSEIIYIDSGSSDDSIELIKDYNNIEIYKIIGKSNPAIARNLGAKISKNNILFFIDGDMEILPENLRYFYDSDLDDLQYEFISGDIINCYYDKNGNYLCENRYYNLESDRYSFVTGGIFIIKKYLWNRINGMRTKFRKNQDLDFGLRMSKEGYFLLRKKEIIAKHHTINYNNNKRFILDILHGDSLYKGVLFRSNLLNRNLYLEYVRKEISLIVLSICLILELAHIKYEILLIYIISVISKIIYKREKKIIKYLLMYMAIDISTLIGFFLFWPRQIKDMKYIKIK